MGVVQGLRVVGDKGVFRKRSDLDVKIKMDIQSNRLGGGFASSGITVDF
jgi:hypothetical protein